MKIMKKLSALTLVGVLAPAMSVAAFTAGQETATTLVEDEITMSESAEDNISPVPPIFHQLRMIFRIKQLLPIFVKTAVVVHIRKYCFHTSTGNFTSGTSPGSVVTSTSVNNRNWKEASNK